MIALTLDIMQFVIRLQLNALSQGDFQTGANKCIGINPVASRGIFYRAIQNDLAQDLARIKTYFYVRCYR